MRKAPKNARGQAATEYLIIVSIVIVIALIAMTTVSGFPSLIGGTSKARSSDFWNRADFAITAYSLSSDGSAVMLLKSRKAYQVEVRQIDIGESMIKESMKLAPGEEKKLTLEAGKLATGTSGSEYSEKIKFVYVDPEENATELVYAPEMQLVGNYE